jgi:hypothetical protein
MAELMDEFNASRVRLHASFLDDLVDQVRLTVSKAVHGFSLRRIIGTSLRKRDAARSEKVPNPVITGLAVHIEPVVGIDIERTK